MNRNLDNFEKFCRLTDEGFEAEGDFYKSLHSLLKANSIDAAIREFPQIGGGACYSIEIPDKKIKVYGFLSYDISSSYFLGLEDFDKQITEEPNISELIRKASDPKIIDLVANNAENFCIGTYRSIDNILIDPKNSIPQIMAYQPKTNWLNITYQFLQNNSVDDIVEVVGNKMEEINSGWFKTIRKYVKKLIG
ncbi:MAG: hypothetical protein Q8R47_02370 [Nanoarchaeota archaeon]|nr:hypothetical protein [Nanoarchaeota archaeon]